MSSKNKNRPSEDDLLCASLICHKISEIAMLCGKLGHREIGVFAMRRYPLPAPDKRACRSSVGVCEPRLACARCDSNPLFHSHRERKNDHRMMVVFLWQRNRDSNPNIQSQSLLCYRYTIPLYIPFFSGTFYILT